MTVTKAIAAICFCSTLTAVSAVAEPRTDSDHNRIAVPYADLNLNRAAGIEVLYQRLKRASRQVCGANDLREAGSARQAQYNRACYEQSLGSAVDRLLLPRLNELHRS